MDFLAEYAASWSIAAIICMVSGIVLVIIEMFTPGFGVAGAGGCAALLAAVIIVGTRSVFAAVITAVLLFILVAVLFVVIVRSFNKGRLSHSRIVLQEKIDSGSTSLSGEDMQALVGECGVCLNTLRPSGNADFSGRKLDVVSDGEFIQKGKRVRVERVEGLRIVVKELPDENM